MVSRIMLILSINIIMILVGIREAAVNWDQTQAAYLTTTMSNSSGLSGYEMKDPFVENMSTRT
jgi:hypothetical protein